MLPKSQKDRSSAHNSGLDRKAAIVEGVALGGLGKPHQRQRRVGDWHPQGMDPQWDASYWDLVQKGTEEILQLVAARRMEAMWRRSLSKEHE